MIRTTTAKVCDHCLEPVGDRWTTTPALVGGERFTLHFCDHDCMHAWNLEHPAEAIWDGD